MDFPNDTPSNDEAENALVGSILIAPEYFRECNAILSGADDFRQHHWKHVWKAFVDLDKQEKTIDSLTVMDEITKIGALVNAVDLLRAMNAVPTTRNAVEYARQTGEAAGRRRLIEYCSTVSRLAHDPSTAFLDGLEKARKSLDDIPVRLATTKTLTDQFSKLYDEIDARRKDPKEVWGIPWGIRKIDVATGGKQYGELSLLVGIPKIGKSTFAAQDIFYGASQGFHCGIYCMEMSDSQVLRRQLATMCGINPMKMRSGFITDGEWETIVRYSSELSKLPLFVVDSPTLTVEEIRADIYTRSKERRVDSVIVDYMGLLTCNDKVDELTKDNIISRGLKQMARQENVSVMAVHSVNKDGLAQLMPKLSAISGSVKHTYNADNIIFFLDHVPEKGFQSNPKMRTLFFAAMRDAPGLSFVHLNCIVGTTGFEAVPDIPLPQEPDYEWQRMDK